jgi:hypothetical protein
MTQDDEHLRLLSIFHYVVGGLAGLFATFPIIHVIVGLYVIFKPENFQRHGPEDAFFGWIFVIIGGALIVVGWTFAIFVITTGRFLAKRKHYMFCLVMACVECVFMPFGTVLGVFTIIVLMRESVKKVIDDHGHSSVGYNVPRFIIRI